MFENNFNLVAYFLGCSSLFGAMQNPETSSIWWLLIGLCSMILFIFSNEKLPFLGVDIVNLVVLALLIQLLPNYLGFYLNVIVIVALFFLLFIKNKLYKKYATQ
ncbi:hypothetical protein [Jeotgalibaca ciconiae]|uniref:Uncharacterized protein n=1 Tax=Jeotgalibaca ciconiae TaxID=2496265 RepID=A0A3Q9BJJ4_9LACT|nr:hypothetical protein [Jeotgalibaca ciconiae]AZP03785.1 hypothetical protein EJN90_03385 [Jeotgalibaca ciconiae]HJB23101.1 hypothetical protein [Candidatus Jeotgalibaca pullicola]